MSFYYDGMRRKAHMTSALFATLDEAKAAAEDSMKGGFVDHVVVWRDGGDGAEDEPVCEREQGRPWRPVLRAV